MNLRITATCLLLLAASQQLQAQSRADRKTIRELKEQIGYLASDELQGRRSGSEGERKAADYIIGWYRSTGIAPFHKAGGKPDYRFPFQFVHGREVGASSRILLGGHALHNPEEAFPLPFSGNKAVTGEVLPDIMEQGNIWMLPLYQNEEEARDPHFDWERYAYEKSKEAMRQGATGVLFYDGFNARYPPRFNPRSDFESLDIAVAFAGYEAWRTHIQPQQGLSITLQPAVVKRERTATNVAAWIDNGAPYTVVLGAHYDHLGLGEDGGSLHPGKDPQVHNGADDNASGTAALMQLAARIRKEKLRHYNYLFVHFSAEELGLLGSKAFIRDLGLDSSKVAYMINMDMVGRLPDSTRALTVGGIGTSPAWGRVFSTATEELRLRFDSSGVGPSDHTPFYLEGIPVLFFFTGTHSDYHKPSDDAHKINYEGQVRVMHLIYDVVKKMDRMPKPAFTPTKQSTAGKVRFKVTLGIMPDYSFPGPGVRIDGVSEGKPAQRSGLKAGDVVLKLGAHSIGGMQGYMEALSKFKPGDQTTVTFARDGQEQTVPLQFDK